MQIAKNIKTLNIITNDISTCNKLEEYLYNEYGIMLNIANNKRKSLLNAELILNIDFPEELINKYKICKNAIIINFEDKIKINSKRFEGININYYKIAIPSKYELIYESIILHQNNDFKNIMEKLKKEKIKIKKLIGNNGLINEKEIVQIRV